MAADTKFFKVTVSFEVRAKTPTDCLDLEDQIQGVLERWSVQDAFEAMDLEASFFQVDKVSETSQDPK